MIYILECLPYVDKGIFFSVIARDKQFIYSIVYSRFSVSSGQGAFKIEIKTSVPDHPGHMMIDWPQNIDKEKVEVIL